MITEGMWNLEEGVGEVATDWAIWSVLVHGLAEGDPPISGGMALGVVCWWVVEEAEAKHLVGALRLAAAICRRHRDSVCGNCADTRGLGRVASLTDVGGDAEEERLGGHREVAFDRGDHRDVRMRAQRGEY